MKLTDNQKLEVYNQVKDYLKHNEERIYTSPQLVSILNLDLVSPSQLTNIMKAYSKLEDNILVNNENRLYEYKYMDLNNYLKIKNWKKEKDNLYFYDNDINKSMVYNFTTHQFQDNQLRLYPDKIKNDALTLYHYCCDNSSLKEWVFSYIDKLDNIRSIVDINFDCPKGYIDYINSNNLKISVLSYKYFMLSVKLNVKNQTLLENIYNFLGDFDIKVQKYILDNQQILNNIVKIMISSIKMFEFSDDYLVRELVNRLYKLRALSPVIDTNRGINYNIKQLIELENNNKNKLFNTNLQRLNFMNCMTIGKYLVVVPQNVNELQNEGKQQNNCVGYYYNDSIQNGENLIYFLRDIENPTKSLVTCRYNLYSKCTSEHRIKNNYGTTQEQRDIIKKIDEIIHKELNI